MKLPDRPTLQHLTRRAWYQAPMATLVISVACLLIIGTQMSLQLIEIERRMAIEARV
ncbi:hypothetical protein [Rhizobium rhizosphaerae]|uniref:hypothetical protein n=1 Tax=Xaviernesmea rhizosphaerae TaxID=1672749 RepID=UPI000AB3FBEF|nr:hypothetical protein [Xaviernesmea rhizosphaerae]